MAWGSCALGNRAARLSPIDIPLGDATLSIKLRIPGVPRHHLRIRVGVPRETEPEDRVVNTSAPRRCPTGRASIVMDLAADQQVTLDAQWTDEVGNPTEAPVGATFAYTNDNPAVVNLTDNGDGTGNAAAVGPLGTANIHLDATDGSGGTLTGDLQINVVAGLAERVNIVTGEPTEVTPDVEPEPGPEV